MLAVERASEFLLHACQRDVYDVGASARIARDVSETVLRIWVRTLVFDDAHRMVMPAALLGKGGLAIAFSCSGSRLAAIDAIELARKNGANTMGATAYPDRPLACNDGVV